MSGLQPFRNQLRKLRARRRYTRFQAAAAHVLVFAIVALYVLLLIDLTLRLDTTARATWILLFGVALVWQAIRRLGPQLLYQETIVDIALLLEQIHGVDNDLVAALQFDSSAGERAGSRELQRAVIDQAAKASEHLDFRRAAPQDDARRALRHATMAVLSVAVCWFAFPNYASAYWNRLWLGDARYPTRTRIDEVIVNGRTDVARVVEDEMVEFRVTCSGVTPDAGIARLHERNSGDTTTVTLKRINHSNDAAVYAGAGPNLTDPVECSLRIGDAESETFRIDLIRRPIVELMVEAEPPGYMHLDPRRQRQHHVTAMEGSNINFSIGCTNGKRLAEVRLELIEDGPDTDLVEATAFTSVDKSARRWKLDADVSGLTRVAQDCQFRIVVVDEDGLGTYHPLEGEIQVKPDLAPSASVASLHYALLPNARPTIVYDVEDDFGVGSIVLHVRRATPQDPRPEQPEAMAIQLAVPAPAEAIVQKAVHGEHTLDLSPLDLVEHDKLLVWIQVTDYRGEWLGVSAISESIEWEILDERGVIEAILRSDADAEQILTDAIEKELGLKGDR